MKSNKKYDIYKIFGLQENPEGKINIFEVNGRFISVSKENLKIHAVDKKLIAIEKGKYSIS